MFQIFWLIENHSRFADESQNKIWDHFNLNLKGQNLSALLYVHFLLLHLQRGDFLCFLIFFEFWKKNTNCFLIKKNHHFVSGTTRNVRKAMHVSFLYLVYVSMMNYVLTLDHPLPMDKVKSFRDIFAPCPLCCDVVNSSRCGIWIRLRHIHLFIILSN
jgi:hypothetical protein